MSSILWDSFPDKSKSRSPEIPSSSPKIQVLSEEWLREKCDLYGLKFDSLIRQPSNLAGQPLSCYQPWETESIVGDGNCLYRCLAKVFTGKEDNYPQMRKIISHFIASEGTTKLVWYFKQKQITPCNYLLDENPCHLNGIWGSDVEIMTASCIFNVDIYVATNNNQGSSLIRVVRWNLHRATDNPESAIYIQNFNHYEPVISMINCPTPSYGNIPGDVQTLD